MTNLPELTMPQIEAAVKYALIEDLGHAGDLTSIACLGEKDTAEATINAREPGIIAGLALAAAAFRLIGPGVKFEPAVADGDAVSKGGSVAKITGRARPLLSAERVALNYLNHLSGIATLTSQFVEKTEGTNARVCDTRKTVPGLRAFEKYAVKCGGGSNHRFGLDDAILIKDNHIAVAGGVAAALAAARTFVGHMVAIEIEVDTLDQLAEALENGAQIVLLDNMSTATLRKAVAMNAGRAQLEASGNVSLDTVAEIAKTGVDYISTSKITMAAPPLDLGLDVIVRKAK